MIVFVPEVTVVMPCVDEPELLVTCIQDAKGVFQNSGIAGEVVIAVNGKRQHGRFFRPRPFL